MSDMFLQALSITLREETGYGQPVGGPFLRHANGSTAIPTKPDDRFFSDDKRDRGGRTGAGILQKEYTPWREARGLTAQDVWLISDAELIEIYRVQYWNAVRAAELPPGVAVFVFDFGVHSGVGTSVRHLQSALGVKVDGHIGAVTLAAAHAASAVELVRKLRKARAAYQRQCVTFRVHGNNWLERTARVGAIAEAQAAATPGYGFALIDAPALDPNEPTAPRANLPPEPENMLQSSTGNAAVLGGGGTLWAAWNHLASTLQRITERGEPITARSVALELATDPMAVALAVSVVTAAFVWFERRRRMGVI